MEILEAWLRLSRLPGLDGATVGRLLATFSSPGDLLGADAGTLRAAGATGRLIGGLEAARAARIDADLRWLDAPHHHLVTWGSSEYPTLLAQINDAPPVIYLAGRPEALAQPQIAIVGARNPTPTGRDNASAFAAGLVGRGFAITSGLALGIDAAAHRGALAASGSTVAVCACGLDRVYPRSHARLAAEIATAGALVSEFAPGTPPLKHHFPHRNRLISGLSLGTLVVEAATRSGSLITARLAAEQGREVFAIPGSIHNPLARGCHRLIADGARLVEACEDILSELGPLETAAAPGAFREPPDFTSVSTAKLDKDQEILLDALGFEPAAIDLLVERSGLAAGEVASMLLILELEGRVESCPGGLYIRTRSEAKR